MGRAIVERLCRAGFLVAFTYNTSGADAQQITRQTGALAIQADLTQPQNCVNQITRVLSDSFGHLDLLVNNASMFGPAGMLDFDLELSRQLMAIHFESPLLLCKQLSAMLRKARGHVVNMLDAMVEKPMPKHLAYCASKAALWNLTLSLARELAPEVTVNGIAPGVVEWPPDFPQEDRVKYIARVPLGRIGTPVDVAETVYFLATTGSYINGQILRLDGGRSIA